RVHPRERVADEHAARHREPALIERAELRARVEADLALVVRETRDEQGRAPAHVRRPARLQPETGAVLLRARAVDRRALDVVVRGDQRAVLVEDELFLAVLLLADEARRVLALLEVRVVAVIGRDVA